MRKKSRRRIGFGLSILSFLRGNVFIVVLFSFIKMKNKRGQVQPTMQQQPAAALKPTVPVQLGAGNTMSSGAVVGEKKKSKWWLWLIIILVLLGVLVGIAFWLLR